MPTVGRIIANKYELARLLGRGSMGQVWVAHHLTLGEDVALKLLGSGGSDGVEALSTASARFRFEAQVAAHLSRKTRHIVRVTDHGEEDDLAYLVMELLEGETLERRLLRRGCFVPSDARVLVAQIARALTEAHAAKVIHRDLKPANIFLTVDEDGGLLVKLLDFGIARTVQTHSVPATFATGQGLVFGTPGYMSPEQAVPSSRLDHRCDLWALATVAYEALTEELPVAGASIDELLASLCAGRIIPLHERNPSLPAGLGPFFARAFARDPEERYASAIEIAQAFERAIGPAAQGHEGVRAATPGTLQGHTRSITFPMWHRRRRDPSSPLQRPRGRSRLIFAAPVVALFGLPAAGMAWHEMVGPQMTSAMAPTASAFELVATSAGLAPRRLSAPPFDSLQESAALSGPEPDAGVEPSASSASERPRAYAAGRAPAHPVQPPGVTAPAAQCTESPAPDPARTPPPAPRVVARKPFDKSEVL